MPGNEEHILENLIRGSEALLRDIVTIGAPDGIERDIEEQEASLETLTEPSTDGTIDLTVSKDEMLVNASFYPPTGNGKPLTLEAVRKMLEAKGITTGIDWEAVKGCILTCNEQRITVSDVVIARGRKPVDEVPPYLVISDLLATKERKAEPSAARVDFRELSLFSLVKKGDVLATLTAEQQGAMGQTVRGTLVPYGKEALPNPSPGRNTQWQSGSVVSLCDGRFQMTAEGLWVEEVLAIQDDIDLRVGNIDFPGDVVIKGELRDGFAVKAGKSILCVGSINAARVECKGDLVTRSGIIGKERAILHVGGAVEAKFIEGSSLDAAGLIRVRTSVINSTIRTRDRLEMGDRGIIIGGVVRAVNGVSTAQIGTERGPRTEIHCGIDFTVEQKLISIRDRNIALAIKLREIEAKMKASPGTRTALAPLREKIKAAIHQLNDNARALVSSLDRNEEARVSVRETVYPGTYIEICHVSYFVTRPRRTVTFRLDKSSGKIVEMSWEKK